MCALRLDPPPHAVDGSVEHRARGAPSTSTAARTLIASRTYLEAADAVERMERTLHHRDFAGYDVLRGAGLTAAEASAAWQQLVHEAIEQIAASLRDHADHDFDRAVASIGATVRATRRTGAPTRAPARRRAPGRRHRHATRVR